MFAMRFVVQWIASERAGRSVVPTAFWVFSIGGGFMLLAICAYRKDPVFIIGQAFGVFVYLRNLQFVCAAAGRARRPESGNGADPSALAAEMTKERFRPLLLLQSF